MKFYIYILQSLHDDKHYVGFSTDPWNRLIQHNTTDRTTFTSKYRPWKLVAVFYCPGDQSNAMIVERFIKRQKRKSFIQRMITSNAQLYGILQTLVKIEHDGTQSEEKNEKTTIEKNQSPFT